MDVVGISGAHGSQPISSVRANIAPKDTPAAREVESSNGPELALSGDRKSTLTRQTQEMREAGLAELIRHSTQ